MPIYEFYCPDCHMVFSFRSRRIDTETVPDCPSCKASNKLKRQISPFAVVSSSKSEASDDPLSDLPIDESRMERALMGLASEAESLNEDDPKSMALFMRKFAKETGLEFNDSIQQALSRLESGEDPEVVEAEMGDVMDSDENPFKVIRKGWGQRTQPPRRDDTLYDM